jgi:endonuclease YncB( thermonuclease family)
VQDRVAPIDGDTLKSSTTEVRLYGIDAPELAETCTDANGKEWACGRRQFLAQPARKAPSERRGRGQIC